MTIREALKAFRQEDQSIRILRDSETEDLYIAKPTVLGMIPPTILAWVCGQESDHFISYEGLNTRKSYLALCDLAEMPPKEREGNKHDDVGRPLTCKQFVEEFNAISEDYVADTYLGYVEIYDAEYGVSRDFDMARLDPSSCYWLFEFERAYSWKELMLMAKLAATPPMFRNPPKEGKNND